MPGLGSFPVAVKLNLADTGRRRLKLRSRAQAGGVSTAWTAAVWVVALGALSIGGARPYVTEEEEEEEEDV